MEIREKMCSGSCSVCKGYGEQCWRISPSVRSFLWWRVVMALVWNIQSLLYWITNMHWNGADPKKHWFCYKKHIAWATYKRGVLSEKESKSMTKKYL